MDAKNLKYHDFVKVLEKKKTNGLDVTFKCLSLMLKKTIIVISEDYLWLSHGINFHDFDVFFVMNQGGEIVVAKQRMVMLFIANYQTLSGTMTKISIQNKVNSLTIQL